MGRIESTSASPAASAAVWERSEPADAIVDTARDCWATPGTMRAGRTHHARRVVSAESNESAAASRSVRAASASSLILSMPLVARSTARSTSLLACRAETRPTTEPNPTSSTATPTVIHVARLTGLGARARPTSSTGTVATAIAAALAPVTSCQSANAIGPMAAAAAIAAIGGVVSPAATSPR